MNRQITMPPAQPDTALRQPDGNAAGRTTVEINDATLAMAVLEQPTNLMELLMQALTAGSNSNWRMLERYGIRRIEDRAVPRDLT